MEEDTKKAEQAIDEIVRGSATPSQSVIVWPSIPISIKPQPAHLQNILTQIKHHVGPGIPKRKTSQDQSPKVSRSRTETKSKTHVASKQKQETPMIIERNSVFLKEEEAFGPVYGPKPQKPTIEEVRAAIAQTLVYHQRNWLSTWA